MARQFRSRRAYAVRSSQWQRVKAVVRCSEPGQEHDITAPAIALFWPFRPMWPRMILCRQHAEAKGYTCEAHVFGLNAEAPVDEKARQAGGDE